MHALIYYDLNCLQLFSFEHPTYLIVLIPHHASTIGQNISRILWFKTKFQDFQSNQKGYPTTSVTYMTNDNMTCQQCSFYSVETGNFETKGNILTDYQE